MMCRDGRPYWKVFVSLIISLALTVLVILGGYGLLRLFFPFVIGWLIACIANPLVCWLEKRLKITKKWGSAIVIVAVLAIVVGILYLVIAAIAREAWSFVSDLPKTYAGIEKNLKGIGKSLKNAFAFLPESVRNGWQVLVSRFDEIIKNLLDKIAEPTVKAAGNVVKRIPSAFIAFIVMLLSSYFFVAERETVISWVKKITPKPVRDRVSLVLGYLKYAIGGYFKAQFEIMLILFVIMFAGFLILRVKYAAVIAILAALLDFLPFFGTAITLIPWAVYHLFQRNFKMAVGLLVIYLITQIVRQIVQPKLLGDRVGLGPLPTLLFIYLGYKVGSVWGMIFAVPIGMIVINMYKVGAFDYILDDAKILIEGLKSLRTPNAAEAARAKAKDEGTGAHLGDGR